jgi:hypothetical protein
MLIGLTFCPTTIALSGWQLAKAQSNHESQIVAVEFPAGPSRDATGRTSGGGTRGNSCVQEKTIGLTALMPGNNIGTTVATEPTLFVYVPKNTAQSAELVVIDDAGNPVYSKTFEISTINGIVKVNLPKNAALTPGKEYIWQFALVCDGNDRAADKYVQGTLKPVELSADLQQQLKLASPLQQAQLYAEAGIWNETLITLADLRGSNPTEWEELLDSVGLKEISSEPFSSCCNLEN